MLHEAQVQTGIRVSQFSKKCLVKVNEEVANEY